MAEEDALEEERAASFADAFRRAHLAVTKIQGMLGLPPRADLLAAQAHRALADMAATQPPGAGLAEAMGWLADADAAGAATQAAADIGSSKAAPAAMSASEGALKRAAPTPVAARIPTTPRDGPRGDGPRPPSSPPPRWATGGWEARPAAAPGAVAPWKKRRFHGNKW